MQLMGRSLSSFKIEDRFILLVSSCLFSLSLSRSCNSIALKQLKSVCVSVLKSESHHVPVHGRGGDDIKMFSAVYSVNF